jgi:hypothetical protein
MTVLTRGARARRRGRRPGWLLLTVLLVLAIAASSALVFTNRVELLKLAVILALWAAVVAAFVSVIYRRQSDIDQAKARDLKLVYDLQLDREISARREYELTVETHLRRELSSELRAEADDEVAALRAELAALRANLEILFDADLGHRPALETERTTVRAYSDWARDNETTGRVSSSRIDFESREDFREDIDDHTAESPIIDVPEEPLGRRQAEWVPPPGFGGAHRRPSEAEPTPEEHRGWGEPAPEPAPEPRQVWEPEPVAMPWEPAPPPPQQPAAPPQPPVAEPEPAAMPWEPPPPPPQQPAAPPQPPVAEPEPAAMPWEPPPPPQPPPPPPQPPPPPPQHPEPPRQQQPTEWRPVEAEGQWLPPGAPGSNWSAPATENGSSADYTGRRSAPEPVMPAPAAEPRRGRHSSPPEPAGETGETASAQARHSAPPDAVDPGRPAPPPPPTLATPRHRTAEESEGDDGAHTGGQSVAELLARLQVGSTGGGRRRRPDE